MTTRLSLKAIKLLKRPFNSASPVRTIPNGPSRSDGLGRLVALNRRNVALLALAIILVALVASPGAAQDKQITRPSGLTISVPSNFTIVYPLMAARRTSGFGNRNHPVLKVQRHHNGIDLGAPTGTPIRSIKNGVVIFADPLGGYGNLIVVKHKNDFTSHYGHCSKILVRPGQTIKAGQIIGEVGATGRVTGAHLHLEIRKNGEPLNPDDLILKLSEQAEG